MIVPIHFKEPDCSLCDDTGWVHVMKDGFSAVKRCECFEGRMSRSLAALSGIPEVFADKLLDNFKPSSPPQKHLLQTARAYVRMFPTCTPPGLILGGPTGVGKSHIAVGIAAALIARNIEVKFFDTQVLLENARLEFDDTSNSVKGAAAAAQEPHVIILDDLGGRRPSPWLHDIVAEILVDRMSRRKPTIITTSARDEMFGLPRKLNEEDLADRIGVRARSKVIEMCQPVWIGGDDYRQGSPSK